MAMDDIAQTVSRFISKNFLFDEKKSVSESESLLGTGVIDSTGVLELIAFLEQHYELKFEDAELVAENFDSINNIKSFISKKIA